ncbi:hypothetical protein HJFPF1_08471 [Paramyrothecium foliicola]|nr:hypothetical protein HJFPF1_08471 [Paramyrothecium foliicola]
MGIPYSKEVHGAFEQVTPLVAAGFDVLKTTKNIAVLLAVIQVLIGVLLTFVLFAILAVAYSINPDLEKERQELVTPLLRWLASWILTYGTLAYWCLKVFIVLSTASLGIFLWQGSRSGYSIPRSPPNEQDDGTEADGGKE